MDNTGCVHRHDGFSQAHSDCDQSVAGEWSVASHIVVEVASSHVLSDEIRLRRLKIRIEIPCRANASHPSSGFNFSSETCSEPSIVSEFGTNQLDGDSTALWILGEINDPHPAGTNPAKE